MPHIPVAFRRVPNRKEIVPVCGDKVEIYSYKEEYTHQLSFIRGLLGFDKTYSRRLLRAEAPEHFHSRVSPDVSYEEQKQELLEDVRVVKEHQQEITRDV